MLSKEEKAEILDSVAAFLCHAGEHTEGCGVYQGKTCTCGYTEAVVGISALKVDLEKSPPQKFWTHKEKGGRYLYLNSGIPAGSLKDLLVRDSLIAYLSLETHELFLRKKEEWFRVMQPL